MTEQDQKDPRDKKPNPPPISAWRRLIHDETDEISEQLIKYAIRTFGGLVLFALFVVASIAAEWLCTIWPESSIMIIIKIVAWIISALGGLLCIALVVNNTILFLKFLFKSPPEETSVTNAAGERRVK